jgi:putative Ca2+/H+ antiporter (TMEM165/GDT1 family)
MAQLFAMFFTIFVAELGDKTQLATVLFASERRAAPLAVFAASASALVLGAAVSTAIGALGGRWLEHVPMKLIAGIGFIAIGIWSIWSHYRAV